MKYSIVAVAAAAPLLVSAQQTQWGQCGGIGWNGPTNCVSGNACSTLNPYYAQCLPGAQQPTTTPVRTTTTPVRTTTTPVITTTSRTTTPGIVTSTTTRTTTGANPTGTGLHAIAVRNGFRYFGFATDPNSFQESQVANIIRAESGQVTPENSMKWESIHTSQTTYNWGNADALVAFAQQNNQLIRGHTLVWHSQLPQWVKNINNKAQLTQVIQDHVAAVMGRYKGKIDSWDVANEVLNDDGSMRVSVFSQVFGDYTFLDVAFRAARAADPAAKLCLNDYNLDYAGAKLNNFVNIVNGLKQRGVPIDCVGTQDHLVVGNGAIPSRLSNLNTLGQPGLEIQITELDIRANTPVSSSSQNQQVTDYRNVACACKKQALCKTITVWGVSDKHSWVPSTFSGQGYALLWTDSYVKKSAYQGVVDGLNCT